MSGDDVRGNEQPDAQEMMPSGARTAPAAGTGSGTAPEINWVGQQHLMWGYCGRRPAAGVRGAGRVATAVTAPRVVLHRARGTVVRIGPRPLAEATGAPARAA